MNISWLKNLDIRLIYISLFIILISSYIFKDSDILLPLTNEIRWGFKTYGKLFLTINFCLIIIILFIIDAQGNDLKILNLKLKECLRINTFNEPIKAPITQEGNLDHEMRLQKLEAKYQLTIENIKKDIFNSKPNIYVPKESSSSNIPFYESRSLNDVPSLFPDISNTTNFPAQSTETLGLTSKVPKTIIDLTIENFPENKDFFKDNSDFTPYSNSSLDNSVDPSGVAIVRLTSSSYFNSEFLLFNYQSCDYIIPNPCCTRFKTLMSTFEDSSPVYKFMVGNTQSSPKLMNLCKASPNDANMWSIIEIGVIG